MASLGVTITARGAFRAVVAVMLLAMLGANLPGHLSYDSVAQLYEGHFNIRNTWGPALYAWILGVFDRFVPGTALYVTASGLLFFGSLASLSGLRGRTGWLAAPVALLILLTPQVMVYQAIVWKDVAFANCAIGGLICLAHAARDWAHVRRRWLFLLGALVLLAVASQVRQNGIIAGIMAGAALGWIASAGRWRRGVVWGLAGVFAIVLAGQTFTVLSTPKRSSQESSTKAGVRIVQNYDLIGAAALDPAYDLSIMAAADPSATRLIRDHAKADYSGRRVDFIDRDELIGQALANIPDPVAQAQWFDLILKHPGLYLKVRWEDFRWLVIPPVIDWCLPVYVGIDAPAEIMAPLRMQHRYVQADVMLSNYSSWFLETPVYSHLTYVLVSLVLAGLFLWRRQPADIALAAMQLAGVGFTASFFIITIACDYRYLYFTDLAAMTGLIYAAVDPPFRRRKFN